MPAWYRSIVHGGTSKRSKGPKLRDGNEQPPADDMPVASTSTVPGSTVAGADASAAARASDLPTSEISTFPDVGPKLDVPSPEADLPAATATSARSGAGPLNSSTTVGMNGSAVSERSARSLNSEDSMKSAAATAKSPASGPIESTSSASEVSTPLDIATTHTILSNPLPVAQAASLSSSLTANHLSSGVGNSAFANSLTSSTAATGLRAFDIDDMISRLLDHGYSAKITKSVALKNAEITAVCQAAREIFLCQPTLLELSPAVKIVGDVHGQYSDLIRLFEMCGFPPSANYLFLGDYVDRGKQSLETILLLLCYKIKYPENFFLLRGNHECANVTRVYGFYDECKRRCNIKIWKTFIDVFNCLPISAVVAAKIFCVHGGLSPSLSSMEDIRRIQRPADVPDYGLLNDLLWSDPSDTALDWEDNERGVSYCFGKSVIQDFLARYDFDLICRAHMVVEDGYEFWNERTLVTIFSAPNYCGEFDNHGAVMSVSEDLLCSFELLKPLDNAALKKEMARGRRRASAAAAAASEVGIVDGNVLPTGTHTSVAV